MQKKPYAAPLLVFAKAPVVGTVKTRLMPTLSAEEASNVHKALVIRTLSTVKGLPLQLWCAPDARHSFFQHCQAHYGVSLHAQSTGDLGDKMGQALDHSLIRHPYAVLIGSDCPALTYAHVQRAFIQLEQGVNSVVTPTEDGGFCLIGISRPCDGLFDGIDWGTAQVFQQLSANLSRLQWTSTTLDTLWDIDRPEDYARFKRLPHDDNPSLSD